MMIGLKIAGSVIVLAILADIEHRKYYKDDFDGYTRMFEVIGVALLAMLVIV